MSSEFKSMPDDAWILQLAAPIVVALVVRMGWGVVGKVRGELMRALRAASRSDANPTGKTRFQRAKDFLGLSSPLVGVNRHITSDGQTRVDLPQFAVVVCLGWMVASHVYAWVSTYAWWPLTSLIQRSPSGIASSLLGVDVFARTGYGVFTPTNELRLHVRRILLGDLQPGQEIPQTAKTALGVVEPILRRVGSVEGRRAYLLFGPEVFQCDFCRPLTERKGQAPSPAGWSDMTFYSLLITRFSPAVAKTLLFVVLTIGPGPMALLDRILSRSSLACLGSLLQPLLLPLSPLDHSDSEFTRYSRRSWRLPSVLVVLALFLYRAAYTVYLGVFHASIGAGHADLDHWNAHFTRVEHIGLALLGLLMLFFPSSAPISPTDDEKLAQAQIPTASLEVAQATVWPLLQAQAAAMGATTQIQRNLVPRPEAQGRNAASGDHSTISPTPPTP